MIPEPHPDLDDLACLRAAIEQHRLDIWGDGPVGHPEDVRLYQIAGLPDVIEAESST